MDFKEHKHSQNSEISALQSAVRWRADGFPVTTVTLKLILKTKFFKRQSDSSHTHTHTQSNIGVGEIYF